MLRTVNFGLLIILQVITAEPPPQKCMEPPPGVTNPEKCCQMPNTMFSEEDIKECGIENIPDGIHAVGPVDCSKPLCLLKRYNLVKDDSVDIDVAAKFIDERGKKYPDYKGAFEKAKEVCLKPDPPGPPHLCQPLRIIYCVKHVMNMECPKWQDSDNCKKAKDHLEECKAYFH